MEPSKGTLFSILWAHITSVHVFLIIYTVPLSSKLDTWTLCHGTCSFYICRVGGGGAWSIFGWPPSLHSVLSFYPKSQILRAYPALVKYLLFAQPGSASAQGGFLLFLFLLLEQIVAHRTVGLACNINSWRLFSSLLLFLQTFYLALSVNSCPPSKWIPL